MGRRGRNNRQHTSIVTRNFGNFSFQKGEDIFTIQQVIAAIVMMKRAPCKGDEATIVASTIAALERLHAAMTAPPPELKEDDGDDARTSK